MSSATTLWVSPKGVSRNVGEIDFFTGAETSLHAGLQALQASTETPPEDFDAMILRYRPHQARVIFELGPLR